MNTITTDVCIIGAGPSGLFAGFKCGMHKLSFVIVDALDIVGGQCATLYPEKPIYDIPAHPSILAGEMINRLVKQIEPFNPIILLEQKIDALKTIDEDTFELSTSAGQKIIAKAVIVAAGVGAFGPNRPPIDGLEEYEESKAVQYFVRSKNDFVGKSVVIAGGGDSAVDWAISLAEDGHCEGPVRIIHRRNKFRATPASVDKMEELEKQGKLQKIIPYQLEGLKGENGKLSHVVVKTLKGEELELEADVLLPFYGLSQNLGEILDWELGYNEKLISVNPATHETSIPGVFAVGDVCDYEGKLKIILTGFSESATAVHNAVLRIKKDEVIRFEHSSTTGMPQK